MTARRPVPLIALFVARALSGLGTAMTWTTLPWLVLNTSGSAAQMSLVFTAECLGVLVATLPGGGMIEKFGARRIMVLSDLLCVPMIAAIPVLSFFQALSLPIILAVSFGQGIFVGPYLAAGRLILPEIVGEKEEVVARANSFIDIAGRVAFLSGPALAGVLIVLIGPANVLIFDAASYFVSLVLVATMVPGGQKPREQVTEGTHVLAGLRSLFGDRVLRNLGLSYTLTGILLPLLYASVPVLAHREYAGDSRVAGILFTTAGVGMALGSLAAFVLLNWLDHRQVAIMAAVCYMVPLWALTTIPSLPVLAVCIIGVGMCIATMGPMVISTITLRTPVQIRPRVLTAVGSAEYLASPVAYTVAGPLLELYGLRFVFVIIGMLGTTTVMSVILAMQRARTPIASPFMEEYPA